MRPWGEVANLDRFLDQRNWGRKFVSLHVWQFLGCFCAFLCHFLRHCFIRVYDVSCTPSTPKILYLRRYRNPQHQTLYCTIKPKLEPGAATIHGAGATVTRLIIAFSFGMSVVATCPKEDGCCGFGFCGVQVSGSRALG